MKQSKQENAEKAFKNYKEPSLMTIAEKSQKLREFRLKQEKPQVSITEI